jgi:hypothetical protein
MTFNGDASSITTVNEIFTKNQEYMKDNIDYFRQGPKMKDNNAFKYKIKPVERAPPPAAPASQSTEIPGALKSLLGSMSGGQNIFGN